MHVEQWRKLHEPAWEELRLTVGEAVWAGDARLVVRDASELVGFLRRMLVAQCTEGDAARVWTGLAIVAEGVAEVVTIGDPVVRASAVDRLLAVVDDVICVDQLPI